MRFARRFTATGVVVTLIDIAVVFWFTQPLVSVLGKTKYFGQGKRFSGFEADHLGAKHQPALHRRRPVTKPAAATEEA